MRVNLLRRVLLKTSTVCGIAAAGFLFPRWVLAAWSRDIFRADGVAATIKLLTGSKQLGTKSDDIKIIAPDIADSDDIAHISVQASLPSVNSISLLLSGHKHPLVARFILGQDTAPFISTRIELEKSDELIVLVETAAGFFHAKHEIKLATDVCSGCKNDVAESDSP